MTATRLIFLPQVVEEAVGGALPLAEDDALPRLLALDHPKEQVELALLIHGDVRLPNVLDGQLFRRQVDVHRIVHVPLGQAKHFRRQRGGQEQGLPLPRHAAEDFFDVGAEADVEHPVGLVQHEVADAIERQGAARQVVDDPARRADHQGNAFFQFGKLPAETGAAVNGNATEVPVWGQLSGFLVDLHDQFAGRRQDQGSRPRFVVVAPAIEKRQQERGRLAGAGLGLPDHVAPGEGIGDKGSLDRRGGTVLDAFKGCQNRRGEVEGLEAVVGFH